MRSAFGILLLACAPLVSHAAKTLDIYFIDVEGGQATLILTPAKQSMLIDAGWPGFNGRDAARIADAAKKAGVKTIDYLVTTHYHTDHVGGVPQLLEKLKVKTFVDHGPNNETSKNAVELYNSYEGAIANGKRVTVKPGDTIPMKGFSVEIVMSNGERAPSAVQGAGQANPLCAAETHYPEDKTENARSIGMLFTFGKFRFVNLGDLTARKEMELACPENRIGKVDLYLTTHHGLAQSNAKEIVHVLAPRIAVMNNGARKGGSPDAWKIIKGSPALEDLWQLHFAVAGGTETNSPETLIANLDERCEGKYIKVSANVDGSFTVLNSRNNYQKTYPAR
jgi:beta-lactamase superfamily II metal-dependent hydrolase